MRTPRIAYCSPVNPAASGISDYSEELLPYLGQYADITLYLEDGLQPVNPQLAQHLEVRPLRRLEREQRRNPYDGIVYHMGNSPVHAGIWRSAQRLPGVVVLHEYVLHHFMLWYAANVLHDVQHYVTTMQARYGQAGAHVAQLMIRSRFSDAAFDFPCCEDVVAAARGIVAHSRFVLEQVATLRPELPGVVVPMGVPLPALIDRDTARSRLNLPADTLILASFGHINAYKRLESALHALFELRRTYANAHYILVGSISPHYDLAGIVQRMGLAEAVTSTGYVSRSQFEEYVAATDICLNLRYPTAGETSASLLRLLGAGRPTLVTATGAFKELPPDVAAQVDVGPCESDLILAYCRLLIEQPDVARALGQHARTYVASQHSLEQAARGYVRFLAHLYGWEIVRRIRDTPLWSLEQPDANQTRGQIHPAAHTSASSSTPDLPTRLVAQALAEIGMTEHDAIALEAIATRLADL